MKSFAVQRLVVGALAASTPVLAAKAGHFESKNCADPSGMEQCYKDSEASWTDCINSNCNGNAKSVTCSNGCSCVKTQNEISCANQYCWNQVYSCEYQITGSDLADYCAKPHFDQVPFFPPPDNAPGSCSCNIAKLVMAMNEISNEADDCGANGAAIVKTLTSNDEIQVFTRACKCCAQSGVLSAFWDICPDTDPASLGVDDDFLKTLGLDEDWPNCGKYMEAYPCASKLGYSAPGGSKTGQFYAQGDFPKNGTHTTSNIDGAITSPVSGDSYTYTYNGAKVAISVASADAKPSDKDDDKSDSGSDSDGKSDDGKSSSSSSSSGDKSGSDDDKKDAGVSVVPSLVTLGGSVLLGVLLMCV